MPYSTTTFGAEIPCFIMVSSSYGGSLQRIVNQVQQCFCLSEFKWHLGRCVGLDSEVDFVEESDCE